MYTSVDLVNVRDQSFIKPRYKHKWETKRSELYIFCYQETQEIYSCLLKVKRFVLLAMYPLAKLLRAVGHITKIRAGFALDEFIYYVTIICTDTD